MDTCLRPLSNHFAPDPLPPGERCGGEVVGEPLLDLRDRRRPPARRGLSLVELLVASTVMLLIAGGLAALATVIQVGNEHNYSTGLTVQHGRVALERIERAVIGATANEQFPGVLVFSAQIGGWSYPDTLVVWRPDGPASDPQGLPLMSELVVFCSDPAAPNQLLEITSPDDARTAPHPADAAAWQTELNQLKSDPAARRVKLTDLVRTAGPTDATSTTYASRGAIRFEVTLRPSDQQWSEFRAGSRSWQDVDWAQSIHGATTGLRQVWCRIELQLRPQNIEDNSAANAIPFIGSAALYYELQR